MNSNQTLTVNFIRINVNPPNGGVVTTAGNTATAIANAEYWFIGWSGASTSENTTITLKMNSALMLTANFGQIISDSFTDSRDGQVYPTIKAGEQIWMAKNLNYMTGNNWCYNYADSNCVKYGRLYTWETAMSACPAGWRLPDAADWNILINTAGGWEIAGEKLKSQTGWDDKSDGSSGNGINAFGFSALPGGRNISLHTFYFYDIGSGGYWWSATIGDWDYAGWCRHLPVAWDMGNGTEITESCGQRVPPHMSAYEPEGTASVRCIKN
ncbi:MAG: hypothetical protein FWC23_05125 [Chitinispirillia bacterium]|nr:hypothetical protein [Chitinispirillia bacterium]MCL2268550.1 hypothetical protein [Chitinispirillia bacterium]